jgi:hypothetical protein
MKSRMQHIKLRIVSLLLVILVGGIIFNSAFFLHSHRTACGKIVVHAHPFNKSAENNNPLSKHQHNKIDLNTISSLDFYFNNISVIKINYCPILETEIKNPDSQFLSFTYLFLFSNRAPPANSAC